MSSLNYFFSKVVPIIVLENGNSPIKMLLVTSDHIVQVFQVLIIFVTGCLITAIIKKNVLLVELLVVLLLDLFLHPLLMSHMFTIFYSLFFGPSRIKSPS